MNILFWNLGKEFGLQENKYQLLYKLVKQENVDIACFAEGTQSMDYCNLLVKGMRKCGYTNYYNPNMVKVDKYNLNYPYKSNGLKIFIKNPIILRVPFTFDLQKEMGRIVALDIINNSKVYTIIFLHNFSKNGNRKIDGRQIGFIKSLSEWIHLRGGITQKSDKHFVIGDFNLEPWDYILRKDDYTSINSFFMEKHLNIENRKIKTRRSRVHYFNPLLEYLIPHNELNLAGTYYSENFGWALFDYVLSSNDSNYNFDIITSIENKQVLEKDTNASSKLIKYGFDHLPIKLNF